MTSFLVDGVLLLALLATSWRVSQVYRELRRLRTFQGQFHNALTEGVRALLRAQESMQSIHADSGRTLAAVTAATQEAREMLAELDGMAESLTRASEAAVAARVEPHAMLREALAHAGYRPAPQGPAPVTSARALMERLPERSERRPVSPNPQAEAPRTPLTASR